VAERQWQVKRWIKDSDPIKARRGHGVFDSNTYIEAPDTYTALLRAQELFGKGVTVKAMPLAKKEANVEPVRYIISGALTWLST